MRSYSANQLPLPAAAIDANVVDRQVTVERGE